MRPRPACVASGRNAASILFRFCQGQADVDAWTPLAVGRGSFPDASRGFRMQAEPLLHERLRPEIDHTAHEEDDADVPAGYLFP